ncbi:hypothetical protein CHS0354_027378 [Potamilus streckersoni]|uniref:site-specific DNA-methyltransferase (cytosine-N(4)-specific) n=1 Tax=Potamilus streckersoni TaxID=2493646 RepID=A0AAE0SR93_9BIVA|nr:hypothetical protein CHS0354_027378 [Potamilus streckersoni]
MDKREILSEQPVTPEKVTALIKNMIDSNELMLFMKGNSIQPMCGFSARVVAIFDELGLDCKVFNVLADPLIREGIKKYSNWPTIPQVYYKQEFIGGCDIITEMYQSGMTKNGIKSGLYVSDCVSFMAEMPAECVDLAVTSPPYDDLRDYNGYSFDFANIAQGLFKAIKKGGIVVWVVGDRINGGRSLTSFRQGLYFQEIGFDIHDVMIYQKKNTPFMRSNAYTNCYEFMFVLSKGKPKTFNPLKEKTVRSGFEMVVHNKKADGINKKTLKELKKEKTRTNIWSYAVGFGGTTSDKIAFAHPAVFPEKLVEDHILSWSNPGDLVFDPMCGSGTTCKIAMLTQRQYLGVDISEEYINIAKQRLKNAENEKMGGLFCAGKGRIYKDGTEEKIQTGFNPNSVGLLDGENYLMNAYHYISERDTLK